MLRSIDWYQSTLHTNTDKRRPPLSCSGSLWSQTGIKYGQMYVPALHTNSWTAVYLSLKLHNKTLKEWQLINMVLSMLWMKNA